MKRFFSAQFFLVVGLLFFSVPSRAEVSEASPRLVVHLLDYIGRDYGGAVERGKVLNQLEYQEQVDLLKYAGEVAQQLEVLKGDATIGAELKLLNRLISAKSSGDRVQALTSKIADRIKLISNLTLSPKKWPNLEHAKDLFTRNCASCHGVGGRGEGPAGVSLDPKPANFHDVARMEPLTPFQVYNSIRLGVRGTAMSGFPLPEEDLWDLAFYVLSLRHGSETNSTKPAVPLSLEKVATLSDLDLQNRLGDPKKVAKLRLYQPESKGEDYLQITRNKLQDAISFVKAAKFSDAKSSAIAAYLDGIEPIEPRLRARDSELVIAIEIQMADIRRGIDERVSGQQIEKQTQNLLSLLDRAEQILSKKETSPTLTFSLAAGIVLREAFEAVLLLIALLGVIRSIGTRRAALYVHGGWIAAVAIGVVCWFFSGWVMKMSGLQRELMEGIVSALAVVMVLYLGFWLHQKTEIGKWRAFIKQVTDEAMQSGKLWALASVSFMAVFREAFETVLFLRALLMEVGVEQQFAMGAGVISSFVVVLILSAMLVRFSARIPLKQLFDISSVIMLFLAFILVGKAAHSFQETGLLSISSLPVNLRLDLLGIYPTYETLVPQIFVTALAVFIWRSGKKAHTPAK